MFIKNTGRIRTNIILCCAFVLCGITIVATTPRPVFYTTSDNKLVGFLVNDNLEFNQKSASDHYFAFESWKLLNFEQKDTPNKRYKCEHGVCDYKTKNWNLVYIQKYVPLARNIAELCRDSNVDFIVSYFKIDAPNCNAKILNGGFVIYESGKIIRTPAGRWWNTSY